MAISKRAMEWGHGTGNGMQELSSGKQKLYIK